MEVEPIEKIYQKKSQLEHILLRPDSYVGSIEMSESQLWVFDSNTERFVNKKILYVPGLYKIFDEILVNAADNFQRDKKMDTIKVTIDVKGNSISIWNNGKGIPVQIHKDEKIYVPEMIFGHLLTSSNYDDTQKKVTGGRNGYGAKLTNIYSKKFTVETADHKAKKIFKMTWRDNMSSNTAPAINSYTGEEFTCITFEPDLKRFGMTHLDEDIVALMTKRVYDLAGVISSNVKVFFNGKRIQTKGFLDYVDLYYPKDSDVPKIHDKSTDNDRWSVVVSFSDGVFQQVGFVNSICTSRGGTHVNYITDQVCDKLIEHINKKYKSINIKPHQIKTHLWIFVNCLIENPAFDSQTKETLTTKPSQFGSKCELSDKLIKNIISSGVVDTIIATAKAREEAKMAKVLNASKKSRLVGIAKLEDANEAGTRNAESCTLIITEGDSAKSLAMSGIEVVGRDKFGVFPLKGKLLNVREASIKQITDNPEIQNLMKILGLQVGKKYEDLKSLRYGSLMIMADQDNDGSHIKGLVINFIHHFWPSLIVRNDFLKEFVTPLIKATKGNQIMSFFTVQDFKRWADGQNISQWKIKYYKGLGTSTDEEAREYFQKIGVHQINFKYQNREDDDAVELAFSKKRVEDRKTWLSHYNPDVYVDHNIKTLRYNDFIHKELIQFSISDNLRSIPSICDGLKPGQRKILFACFKRNLRAEIKVAQLSGYVAEHSAYHHGEQSLQQTITGMAQNFVGSNNINLLLPIGQFGSRNTGGKEAASARYIHTNLSKLTRALFPEPDDHLLKYLDDDGQTVEPEWYLPILPMVLVNGAEGIGTGWSTFIPSYNPKELAESLLKKMEGQEFENLKPWFKGYYGDIEENPKGGYLISGKYDLHEDDGTLEISELPIRKWTRDYKTFLEELMSPEDGKAAEIEDIKEYHAKNRVNFVVQLADGVMRKLNSSDEAIEKKFKLTTTMQITNMVLFDQNGKLKRYGDVREIMQEFYQVRLAFYGKRKDYMISKLEREISITSNKVKFILAVISGELQINNVKKKDLVGQLIKKGFTQMRHMIKVRSTKLSAGLVEEEKKGDEETKSSAMENDETEVTAKEYNYLLSMAIWSLTYEKVEELKKELENAKISLEDLRQTPETSMWRKDLEDFLKLYEIVQEEEERALQNGVKIKGGDKGKRAAPKKPRKKKKEDDSFVGKNDSSAMEEEPPSSQKKKTGGGNAGGGRGKSRPKEEKENRAGSQINRVTTGGTQQTSQQPLSQSTISSSMLQYLKFSKDQSQNDTRDKWGSLEQRLKEREKKGDIQKFEETYRTNVNQVRPTTLDTSGSDFDPKDDNKMIREPKPKVMRLPRRKIVDESDEDFMPPSGESANKSEENSGSVFKPPRSIGRARKQLLLDDSEDER